MAKKYKTTQRERDDAFPPESPKWAWKKGAHTHTRKEILNSKPHLGTINRLNAELKIQGGRDKGLKTKALAYVLEYIDPKYGDDIDPKHVVFWTKEALEAYLKKHPRAKKGTVTKEWLYKDTAKGKVVSNNYWARDVMPGEHVRRRKDESGWYSGRGR